MADAAILKGGVHGSLPPPGSPRPQPGGGAKSSGEEATASPPFLPPASALQLDAAAGSAAAAEAVAPGLGEAGSLATPQPLPLTRGQLPEAALQPQLQEPKVFVPCTSCNAHHILQALLFECQLCYPSAERWKLYALVMRYLDVGAHLRSTAAQCRQFCFADT